MKKLHAYIAFGLLIMFSACQSDGSISSDISGSPTTTGQGGSLARFAIANNHLFAVNGTKLKAFDISDRQNPVFKNETELGRDVETIFARDAQTIFIGTQQGMFIYDVSNAPQLDYLSDYEHVVSCDPVVANQTHAFVTLHTDNDNGSPCFRGVNQMDILDVSDLRSIRLVTSLNMDQPKGLGLYGDTLLVCDEGIKIYDISNPASPNLMSVNRNVDAVDIIPRGNLMIVSTTTGIEQFRYKNGQLNFLSRL
jgi:hypothetical protein